MKAMRGSRVTALLFLQTRRQMVVGGQRYGPAALPRVKRFGTLVQEVGWGPGSVWTGAENLAPTGLDLGPSSYAIPAHEKVILTIKFPYNGILSIYFVLHRLIFYQHKQRPAE